jgi:hypothetical protein
MHCLVTPRVEQDRRAKQATHYPTGQSENYSIDSRSPLRGFVIGPSQQERQCIRAYLLDRELCFVALLWGVSTGVAPTTVALDPVRKPVTLSRWLVLSGRKNQRCRHDDAAERQQKCPTFSHLGILAGNGREGKPL